MSNSGYSIKNRVLAIGLDGGTFYLLKKWIDAGDLPNLAKLVREGVHGDLISTIPPITAAAWTSFVTGKNPGKHGLVDFIFPEKDGYGVHVANSRLRKSKTIWDTLARYDRRACIIGMPMTYPPEEINGCMITGFMTPGIHSDCTYPPELKRELLDAVGPFPFAPSEENRFGRVDIFLKDMEICAEARTQTALYLMQKEPWDLFSIVYSTPDMVQHELWPLLDEHDPRHKPEEATRWGGAVLHYYQKIDELVGKLVEGFGDDALVLIMSDHGFGPCLYYFHANNWLYQLGLLHFKKTLLSLVKFALWKLGFTPLNVLKILQAMGLGRLRQNVKSGKGYGLLSRVFLSLADVDWSKTRAFASGSYNKMYINTRDVRPLGCVWPGDEYDNLREFIVRQASDLHNPLTGDAVFQNAYKREDIYTGPYVNDLPDLLLESSRFEYFGFGHADFGSNRIVEPNFGQPGDHRMNGIFIMSGKDVASRSYTNSPNMMDLAPTILYAMGLPVPSDMDGRPLLSAFEDQFQAENQVTFSDDDIKSDVSRTDSAYTEDEEEIIRQRLRDLGYIA